MADGEQLTPELPKQPETPRVQTYDVAPAPSQPTPPPLPKGKIGDANLLHDFDDDADFDRDPAVEAATGRRPVVVTTEPLTPVEPFVKPGFGDVKTLLIVAGVLLLAACVISGINAKAGVLAVVALTLWQGVIHTLTGVAAISIASYFEERPIGAIDLAAARMAVVVSAFLAVARLNLPLPGIIDELLAAAGVYWFTLWILFRRDATSLFLAAAAHFVCWLAVYITISLSVWAAIVPGK
jgi:hypothetical protein